MISHKTDALTLAPRGAKVGMPEEIQLSSWEVQQFYASMIAAGESPKMAETLALRAPPLCNTDKVFNADFKNIGQLDDVTREQLLGACKAQGFNPSGNAIYLPQLAQKTADPRAFITGGRGELAARCEELGVVPQGGIVKVRKTPPSDLPPKKQIKLARDCQSRIYKEYIRHDPSVARRDKREVLHEIRQKHGRKR